MCILQYVLGLLWVVRSTNDTRWVVASRMMMPPAWKVQVLFHPSRIVTGGAFGVVEFEVHESPLRAGVTMSSAMVANGKLSRYPDPP